MIGEEPVVADRAIVDIATRATWGLVALNIVVVGFGLGGTPRGSTLEGDARVVQSVLIPVGNDKMKKLNST